MILSQRLVANSNSELRVSLHWHYRYRSTFSSQIKTKTRVRMSTHKHPSILPCNCGFWVLRIQSRAYACLSISAHTLLGTWLMISKAPPPTDSRARILLSPNPPLEITSPFCIIAATFLVQCFQQSIYDDHFQRWQRQVVIPLRFLWSHPTRLRARWGHTLYWRTYLRPCSTRH